MPDASSTAWLIAPIAGPLTLAVVAFVLGGRWCERLGMAAAATVFVSATGIVKYVWQAGPQTYPLGNWPAPLGIALYADGLSCAMLWMSAVVGTVVSIYALEYFATGDGDEQHRGGQEQFWPLWMLLWSALNALFLSRDVFNLYVTLELLTLAAVGLVVVAGTRMAVEAALRYLLVALVGSLLYLMGVALLYGAHGTLKIEALSGATTPLFATLVLMMLGLMLKTALFPFHFWLPPAHGSAPAPVSALLSALVVKGSFYILLRLWFDLFPEHLTEPVAMLPTVLGSAAIVWGSLQALVTERLKMLVAYSTVAQLGYLFLVFGIARPVSSGGPGSGQAVWSACVLFALSHALAKGALFLAAGTILHVAGHDRVRDLSGVARRLPVTFFTVGVASVSLMGLPPTGAFVAKWTLLKAALAEGHIGLAMVIIGGGLLAAAYLFRVLTVAFGGDEAARLDSEDGVSTSVRKLHVMEYSALALALAAVLLGLAASPVVELIEIGSPWSQSVVEGAVP